MAYSLDSVYKAAEATRAKLEAERAAEEAEMSASLRIWKPPSFDPKAPELPRTALPTVEEVEAIRAEAHKLGLDAGYEAGFSDGQKDGFTVGHKEGSDRGHQEGYEAGYSRAEQEIRELTTALTTVLHAIEELPGALAEPLHELAFQIGERLAGQQGMDRAPFVAAVHEALMRLPKPGETLFLRIRQEDRLAWTKAIDDPGLPFSVSLVMDETVPAGHAYAEIGGMRLNIGAQARKAIVRAALGLDASAE